MGRVHKRSSRLALSTALALRSPYAPQKTTRAPNMAFRLPKTCASRPTSGAMTVNPIRFPVPSHDA